jgi:hypothetical protein
MKEFDSNEVLSSAINNFNRLELSVFMFARKRFSEDTYNYISGLGFTAAAKTIQALLREESSEKNKELIQLLNETIGTYKHRNKIAHNPVMLNITAIQGQSKASSHLVHAKTGKPIDGYSLKEINDIGVKANGLAGRIICGS